MPHGDQELRLVVEFVNTREVDTGVDTLPAWLATGMSRRPSRPEVLRARELREALRTLLLSNNGIVGDVASATAVLDTAARRAGLAVRFGAGAHLEPCRSGVDAVLGRVLGEVALAMADGRWIRLKACRASDCRWAFFDRARNRSRVWCSMDVCGNRSKGRAYRARAR